MLATTHCDPNRSAHSPRSAGRATAAVLMLTLSAPARSTCPTSSAVRTPPATACDRNERLLRRTAYRLEHGCTFLDACRDVEKHDFVVAFALVAAGKLRRITDVAQPLETDTLHHAACLNVETD